MQPIVRAIPAVASASLLVRVRIRLLPLFRARPAVRSSVERCSCACAEVPVSESRLSTVRRPGGRAGVHESRREATVRSVGADLGINPETLRNWMRAAGASRPRGHRRRNRPQPPAPLEAENAALRKAAKHLARETRG
ncbi:transposase [Streptomyces sp. DSM 118878]